MACAADRAAQGNRRRKQAVCDTGQERATAVSIVLKTQDMVKRKTRGRVEARRGWGAGGVGLGCVFGENGLRFSETGQFPDWRQIKQLAGKDGREPEGRPPVRISFFFPL